MQLLPNAKDTDCASPLVRPQRLLKLVSLLESGAVATGDSLAQSLGVCRRTVFRDIKLLRAANIPISFDMSHGTYYIRRSGIKRTSEAVVASPPEGSWVHDGSTCRCPQIQADEIAALLLAMRVVGPLPDHIVDACESALAKILAAALPTAREQAVNLLDRSSHQTSEPHVLPLRPSG